MADSGEPKQHKSSPRWQAQKPSYRGDSNTGASGIHPDDAGVFVTCDRGLEVKCLREMDDILSEYIHSLQHGGPDGVATEVSDVGGDIEGDIRKEIESMKASSTNHSKPYTFVRLEISCVSFIRMLAPLDPVSFVRQICGDASSNASPQRSRYVKRLTPVTCIRKTLGNGLKELCEIVLKPVFGDGAAPKKFAIRPTVRNNATLNRDHVIKIVADAVDQLNSSHSVDLKDYDCLILVEVYRSVCGMSVVGPEFEKLKRFNLSEIYHPSHSEGSLRKNDAT